MRVNMHSNATGKIVRRFFLVDCDLVLIARYLKKTTDWVQGRLKDGRMLTMHYYSYQRIEGPKLIATAAANRWTRKYPAPERAKRGGLEPDDRRKHPPRGRKARRSSLTRNL